MPTNRSNVDGAMWEQTFGWIPYMKWQSFGAKNINYKNTVYNRSGKLTITCSMVQSPSWEANRFAASQEIPRILWNSKVYYCTHKRPPPVPILGQPNPLHISTSHLLEIHPNIIHASTPRSPQWFLSSGFHTKTLYTPSPHPYAPHAQPISFFSILSPAQYWVRSTDH